MTNNKSTSIESLFQQAWKTKLPTKAHVLLIHGLGDHSGRFSHLVNFLNNWGANLTAIDLQGHGKSPGKRGHFHSYNSVMDDIERTLQKLQREADSLPVFLYGHSMGGNLVLNYCLRKCPQIKGVIATSPALKPAFKPPLYKTLPAKILYTILPGFTVPNGLDLTGVSREPSVIDAYKNDPFVHDRISVQLAVDLLDSGKWALENAHLLQLPALLLHGDADTLTHHDATKAFAQKSDSSTFESFTGAYHELHNDLDKEKVFDTIVEWLEKQVNNTDI
ncbi:MAG: alpha/beta hydrolase [Candidatus Marinimicrobia bacterium]|nr:alpha/beta hydrolase [Candidatus Neomarinimicrobiota bacterium]